MDIDIDFYYEMFINNDKKTIENKKRKLNDEYYTKKDRQNQGIYIEMKNITAPMDKKKIKDE